MTTDDQPVERRAGRDRAVARGVVRRRDLAGTGRAARHDPRSHAAPRSASGCSSRRTRRSPASRSPSVTAPTWPRAACSATGSRWARTARSTPTSRSPGRSTLGDGVRIASYAALYGFNHVFDDLEIPIWWQGLDEQGIVVEDDVWIGTHVVICDGVTVGAHSVLAAGSVVTKDVPPYSVVGGVPARVLYDRRDRAAHAGAARRAGRARPTGGRAVARRARSLPHRRRRTAWPAYVDAPATPWKVRPTCDAVEIAAAFGDVAAAGPTDELVGVAPGPPGPGHRAVPRSHRAAARRGSDPAAARRRVPDLRRAVGRLRPRGARRRASRARCTSSSSWRPTSWWRASTRCPGRRSPGRPARGSTSTAPPST